MLEFMTRLKKLKSGFTWLSIGYIILGLLLLFLPTTSLMIVCYGLGALLLLFSLFRLISIVRTKDWVIPYASTSSIILSLLMGLLLIMKPELFISIIPFLLGFLIMVDSFMHVQTAFRLKSFGAKRWYWQLILAAITLVLGVLMVFYPFGTAAVFTMYLGIVLVVDGIMNLVDIIMISRRIKKQKNDQSK